MKWIKASEKLPPMETVLYLHDIKSGTKRLGNFYEDDQAYMVHFQTNGASEGWDIPYSAATPIEWLDESTPEGVTADPRDEEIARLKERLDAAREDEAIRFHDWVTKKGWEIDFGEQHSHTTAELYRLYTNYKKQ